MNVYDMRLKHNIFCETAEFINWIGMDYQILSLRKGEALKDKPADFIQKKVSANPDQFTCASYNSKFLWLGDKKGHIYSIDPQNGVVNRYEIPEIKQPVSNLLVTESGLMYITTNEGEMCIRDSSKMLVKSDKVSHPVAVRYCFENYVEGDVYCDGLPLGSFRSDDW